MTGALEQMRLRLRHRGPDDEGLFLSADGTTGFVHTRLSILDLSPAGHQPMTSPDGRYTITYNGEVYNFRDLRKELEAEGTTFQSRSDTEVLLALYAKHGPGFVRALRGMFAVAIWDEREKSCFLARGPLGIKPLYYHDDGKTLCFASEVRAILASRIVPRRLSAAGLNGYLLYGSVPEPRTLVEDVLCLPAAHSLLWRPGHAEIQKFWDFHFSEGEMAHDASVGLVREALEESVDLHFVSDVPVSLFLSGGVDSTAILALALHRGHRDLSTFCLSVDDRSLDESELAERTARHFGSRHFRTRLDGARGKALFREFLESMDQPTIDGFNTFCVSKQAQAEGAKVVLSGLGGDELFGGYRSFHLVPRIMAWGRLLSFVKPLAKAGGHSLERYAVSPRIRRLGEFLAGSPSAPAAYRAFRGIFTARESQILSQRYLGNVEPPSSEPGEAEPQIPPQPSLLDQISYLELTRFMGNQLLRDSDVMSMTWGLELRVPFVDSKMIEVLSQIPATHRLAHGKKLLLEAVPEIPEWVTRRPKRGFILPFDRWMSEEWKTIFEKVDAASPIPLRTWYRRWSILALENCLERMGLEAHGTLLRA